MKKSKRFQMGLVGSCVCHVIVVVLLGALGLWTTTKDNRDDIMVVSLVGSGGGSMEVGQRVANASERITPKPDDIINISKQPDFQENLLQEQSKDRPDKNAVNNFTNKGESVSSGGSDGSKKGTGSPGAGTGGALSNAQPVVPPRLVHYAKPAYPAAAREKGTEGTVVVRVLVDLAGNVAGADVYESSGSSLLDEAAIAAANRWEFLSAKDNLGKEMSCYVFIPISFDLR